MKPYIAFLDSNSVVTKLIQAPNTEKNWAVIWGNEQNCKCVETFKDARVRNVFPSPGYIYLEDNDVFIPPSPYPSWGLDMSIPGWVPPNPCPMDGKDYLWEESSKSWKECEPKN